MPISVISIVRDEIRNIAGLIDSTLPFLSKKDEWIIIDGGSNDGTWDFLTHLEDQRIIVEQWKQNWQYYFFREHDKLTNKLVSLTKNKWYVSIDADESFPSNFWKSVPNLIKEKNCIGYYFPTYNFYLSPTKYLADDFFYPDYHVRMVRKDKSLWVGDDHKSIWRRKGDGVLPFHPLDVDVKILPYHLFHYARVDEDYRPRLGKEPENPKLADYNGIHPRDEYNESSFD
jgi:glycosyltransferase involved in cell wall biosynthesis